MNHISLVIRQSFSLPKQSQKSRSILQDGSRYLGFFRKGNTHIIVKFYRTDLVICSHSREGITRLIAKEIRCSSMNGYCNVLKYWDAEK